MRATKTCCCRSMPSSADTARITEHRFLSFDATPIYFRRVRAASPKGAVVVVHGMGEHGGRYLHLASHLAEQGFACYLVDLRGFGQSGGKRGCLKHFSDYFRDLESVSRLAREREGFSDLFFLGHSYGGLIVSSYLAETASRGARGMLLSSPNFGISIPVPAWRTWLAHGVATVWPDLTQHSHVEPRFLTHDTQLLQNSAGDRLIHYRISVGLYVQLLARIRQLESLAARLQLPSLILQAGEDRIVSRPATERFYARLRAADKELKVYEGLFHEIFNETSRVAIFREVSNWLLRHSGAST